MIKLSLITFLAVTKKEIVLLIRSVLVVIAGLNYAGGVLIFEVCGVRVVGLIIRVLRG